MSSFYGGGGGGSSNKPTASKTYICTSQEYNASTGLPIITDPEQGVFYLVPANGDDNNNLFNEYIYTDGKWELFGSKPITLNLTNLVDGSKANSVRGTNTKQEDSTYTIGIGAFAEGVGTAAYGGYSHAEGHNTKAFASSSHAEGDSTSASGYNAHSEGCFSEAQGSYSHAEGYRTTASNSYGSHAEGDSTTASGNGSHAEGKETTASGAYSHAEGSNTTASGVYSHAEGNTTIASGKNSHAEGSNTTANHASQHVFGEWNIVDPSTAIISNRGNYIEIVGNGTANNTRSNARTLDWNGNEVLAGKLTVGTAPTNNMDVATKQYVDNLIEISETEPSNSELWINLNGGNSIQVPTWEEITKIGSAILDCFNSVAWLDNNGPTYKERLRKLLDLWTYDWSAENSELPIGLTYNTYNFVQENQETALLVTCPNLNFNHIGDCELEIQCKWYGNSTVQNPQIVICTETLDPGKSGVKIWGNPTSGRNIQTTITGAVAGTDISGDTYHVYNFKSVNKVVTLTVDGVVINSGTGLINNQYIPYTGILGNNMNDSGLYIKSIKFKEK